MGSFMELFLQLQGLLNFTSVFIANRDKKFGALLQNGSWNGLVKMLMEDEIDIAVASLTISKSRNNVIDFCEPLILDNFKFFISRNDERSGFNWFGYLKPLHRDSWMLIASFIILATAALYLAAKQCKDIQLKEFSIEKSLIFSSSALTFARRYVLSFVAMAI